MFEQELVGQLENRLGEQRRFIQIVTGPRQTGKTTAIRQTLSHLDMPYRIAMADRELAPGDAWLESEWMQARTLASGGTPAVLIVDEIQKVPQWPTTVKRLWDEDTWNEVPLHVILSGSSSLLIQKGLSESLAGRFELLHLTHWGFREMREAFGYSLDDFLLYGGYPGAAPLHGDADRWLDYMCGSIIDATISKDVLQMEDVRKPELMQRLFYLGAQYSAQEISYRKLLGQLDDKGNTDTIAHYLALLSGAGLMQGLQKYSAKALESRRSSPRLMVQDTSLMVAANGGRPSAMLEDPAMRGHLVETAVGASLLARAQNERFEVFWWRDGSLEVDFVLRKGQAVTAIEVKSGRIKDLRGMTAFLERNPGARPLVVGDVNTSLESFLMGEVPLFDE